MKAAGAILLVACYELGHQPLAVAWPAAFLERRGYRPAVLDVSVESFDSEKVRQARLVAISVPMHTALRLGVAVARRARALNPTCHIAFYGLYATLNADDLLRGPGDSVMSGEIESALVRLVERLDGVSDRKGAGQDRGEAGVGPLPVTRALEKLDFPVPSRATLPSLKKYAHLERNGGLELVGYVEASRGCKHVCRHCPIPPVYGGRFFVVPTAVVLADVRQLVEAGARHITFGDPDFLNGPGHAFAVARALHAEFPGLTFDVTAKIEHLLRHRDRLAELGRLGCIFIVSAAESLSDTVLRHLDKGHTRADIAEALRAVRAAGIALRPTWVPFTPWTTLDGYRALLEFVEAESLVDAIDPVQYAIRLLVPPGSLLLESAAMRPFLGELVEDAFYYRWTHPDPRMDRLADAVAAAVAGAADRREDASVTFGRVRALAEEAAGATPRATAALDPHRARPPRLTEPWFC
ncbi:MAG: radical SAM protein [Candidatus Rokubacteria bacterium]|nr:radical SAM protein [Candidatus Rokubacteria bacterium]